jgi:hypothetical protein
MVLLGANGPLLAQQATSVRSLPLIEGTTLTGKMVSVPLGGVRPSIVIVAFNSDYLRASSEWFNRIEKDPQLSNSVEAYQLLDIGDVSCFVQPMITWGMRRRVTKAQRGRFIVAFQGDDDLRALLGRDSGVYAVLTTGDGKVLWTEGGPFSDSKLGHIREHLQSDAANIDTALATFRNAVAERCRELIKQHSLPGVAVAVVVQGSLAFAEACGLANKATHTPFTDTTLINVASLSKSVTTWGVLHLVERRHFDLDSSVNALLRQWHFPPSKYDVERVTVRRVLNHTAGLSVPTAPWFPVDKPIPQFVDVLNGAAGGRKVEVIQPPGASWAYSGGGFEVLQLLVEEQSHQPFSKYMQTEILNPLGLTHSTFDPPAHASPEMAVGYNSSGDPVPEYRLVGRGPMTRSPKSCRLSSNG